MDISASFKMRKQGAAIESPFRAACALGLGYETHAPFFHRSSFSPAVSCAARYLQPRRAGGGIYARKTFRRGRQAGVLLVSKSSGPCGSAVFRLGVSFALVGVWAGGIVRIRVWISRQGARFVRIGVRFDRIGARFARIFVLLSMNLGESARIGEFGERHHRVFRHFLCLPIPIIILTAAPGAVILHLSSTGL